MAQIIVTKSGTAYLRDGGQVKRVHTGNNPFAEDGQWRVYRADSEVPVEGKRWIIQFESGPSPITTTRVEKIVEV